MDFGLVMDGLYEANSVGGGGARRRLSFGGPWVDVVDGSETQ